MARQACPLIPDVHLRLAEISLVLDGDADADSAHVRRAARVLPTGATCRYQCGRVDLSSGRIGEACGHWRRSLELSSRHEADILDAAASELTTEELVEQVLPQSPQVIVRIARQRVADGNSPYQLDIFVKRAGELLKQQDLPESERLFLQASVSALAGDRAAALPDYARADRAEPQRDYLAS